MDDKQLAQETKEQLLPILGYKGNLTIRAMFGGYAVRVDDITIGFAAWGKFYFRVDETCKPMFQQTGGEQFSYIHKTREKPIWMPYMTIGNAKNSKCEFETLATMAYDAAKKAKKK